MFEHNTSDTQANRRRPGRLLRALGEKAVYQATVLHWNIQNRHYMPRQAFGLSFQESYEDHLHRVQLYQDLQAADDWLPVLEPEIFSPIDYRRASALRLLATPLRDGDIRALELIETMRCDKSLLVTQAIGVMDDIIYQTAHH